MTTIVASFSEGVMAADSNFEWGSNTFSAEKIYRMPGGALWGVCGLDCDAAFIAIDWVQKGSDESKRPKFTSKNDFNILELSNDGLALYNWTLIKQSIKDDFFAMGSGAHAAKAARLMGADMYRCIEIAARVDSCTKGPVLVVRL